MNSKIFELNQNEISFVTGGITLTTAVVLAAGVTLVGSQFATEFGLYLDRKCGIDRSECKNHATLVWVVDRFRNAVIYAISAGISTAISILAPVTPGLKKKRE